VAGLVEFWTRQRVWRRVAVAGRGGGGGYGGGIPASIPGGCHPYLLHYRLVSSFSVGFADRQEGGSIGFVGRKEGGENNL
jgi:hypothetical protein